MSNQDWLAKVSWAGESVFLGYDTSGHTVVYDSSDGVMQGIGPMRSLLTSLGACSGMDVVSILQKRKQKLRTLEVFLNGDRPKFGLPKPWKTIHIKYVLTGDNLDKKRVREAVRDSVEKYCSVGASLSGTAKITYSYVIRS